MDNDSLKKPWGVRHLNAIRMDALVRKWTLFFSPQRIHYWFFKKSDFQVNLLVRRLACWVLITSCRSLYRPSRKLEGKKTKTKNTNAQLSHMHQWSYLEHFVQQGMLCSISWENTSGLGVLQLWQVGCEWSDLNEDCEARPHSFLLILRHMFSSIFVSHWEAVPCGSLVLALNCHISKDFWILSFLAFLLHSKFSFTD